MDELEKAIAALLAHPNRDEMLAKFAEKAGAIKQSFFQEGFNTGYGKKEGELTAAKTKVTELETKTTQLTAELVEARKANPDIAKLHTDYQAKIEEEKRTAAAALAKATGILKTTTLARTQADLRAALTQIGVDGDFAQVLSQRPDLVARIVPNEADGTVTIMQAGGTIPFQSANGKSALDLLVEELKPTIPAKWITSKADGGSGDQGGGTPPAGVAGVVEQIRKDAKARKEAQGQTPTTPAGVDRLSLISS